MRIRQIAVGFRNLPRLRYGMRAMGPETEGENSLLMRL